MLLKSPRIAAGAIAIAAALVAAGCPGDPLVYDDNGVLVEQVDLDEVEAAGLPGCDCELEGGLELEAVPIVGEAAAVYIIDGLALCVGPEVAPTEDEDALDFVERRAPVAPQPRRRALLYGPTPEPATESPSPL